MMLKLLVLLAPLVVSASAMSQEAETPEDAPVVASKEYFVHQEAGEALVVRISASEARFTSRVTTESGDLQLESGLPEGQMLPVFQFVVVSDVPRQVNIQVEATQITNRTEFDLGLTRLNVRDDRTVGIARAYRLLSDGLEVLPDGSPSDWTVRVQTLFRAASMFEGIGMEELRLWSITFGAHLVLHRMRDYPTALDWANELLAEPRISRYPEIGFAATKLRSSAMTGGRIQTGGADPANSGLQQALEDTIRSARALGYSLEEALAFKESGIDLLDQGRHRQAMQRFNAALDIAIRIEAGDLAAEIREFMVDIHAQAGDLDAGGDVLQDIETHLSQEGDEQELATNLLRQGRLLTESARYRDAVAVLSRAIDLEQSSLTRLQAELALGHALGASGQNEQALVHLHRGVLQPQSGGFRRPGPTLDIGTALNEMAAIHRFQGDWEALQTIREAQSRFVGAPAESAVLSYQLALDSLLRHGASSSRTVSGFRQALQQATSSRVTDIQLLARLGHCGLTGASAQECNANDLSRDLEAIRQLGSPAELAHATLFYSQWQANRGQYSLAFSALDEWLDRHMATGYPSLGAWYWQWREPLVSHYMAMAIRQERNDPANGAWPSFLALAKAREFERAESHLAARYDASAIRSFVRGLPADTVVLSFLVGRDQTHAWVAGVDEVKRTAIAGGDEVAELSRDLREAIQSGSWSRFDDLRRQLGRALLMPVSDDLAATVLLVSHGVLLGLPLQALGADDSSMTAGHRFVQLDAFPPDSAANRQTPFQSPSAIFLAGDPQDWSGEFASRLEISGEIRAVSDQFVGPGLHTVQGVSLLADEFQDERYGLAEIVHLSVPGMIDLSPASDSGLFLSEPARGEGRQRLDSAELANLPNRAGLVFLSRTEFVGSGDSLESRLGIVSALLDAGADAVIASLWQLESGAREQFVSDFYLNLADQGNVLDALALTRRNLSRDRPPHDWAGFQLFIN